MNRKFAWVALLGAVLFSAGCGSDEGIGLDTYPVEGTVTYTDGSPVSGARVTFSAVGGKHASVGSTDASGKYSLITGEADGAPAGEYKVKISGGNVDPKYSTDAGAQPATVKSEATTVDFKVDAKK